jgi:hypothetical protein
VKFGTGGFLRRSDENIQIWLKEDKMSDTLGCVIVAGSIKVPKSSLFK